MCELGVLIMDLFLPGRFSGERNAVGPEGVRRSQVDGKHIFFMDIGNRVFVFSVKLSNLNFLLSAYHCMIHVWRRSLVALGGARRTDPAVRP